MTTARATARRVRPLLWRVLGLDVPDLHRRLDRQHARLAGLERDLARIGPQVAGLEARVEDLRLRLDVPRASAGELDAAVGLVEEIRREHERMRARVSAAARFEERLEQLEDQMSLLRQP